jgi:allantoin racemase
MEGSFMRLLCINPNTTAEVTAKVIAAGQALAPAGITIAGATGRFGARYISSRSSAAIAGHATLDAYAEHGADADAILLACFGDPGLLALRELAHCRVLGLAEASCLAACELGSHFSIITGGERWPAMLEEFVAQIGLSDRLASIRAVAPTGGEIAANPAAAHAILADACQSASREDGADVIILGGAGLVGIAGQLRTKVSVPLLCSIETGFRSVFAQMLSPFSKPTDGVWALPPAIDTIGLNSRLASQLSRSSCSIENSMTESDSK